MKIIALRIILVVLMLVSVFCGWWIPALIFGLIGCWLFDFFIEIIIAGVLFDSLFGYSDYFGIWGYAGTIIAFVILLSFFGLSKVLRN